MSLRSTNGHIFIAMDMLPEQTSKRPLLLLPVEGKHGGQIFHWYCMFVVVVLMARSSSSEFVHSSIDFQKLT